MSELQININLDNAAFGDHPEEEVARILHDYCNSITKNVENLDDKYSFIDFNGNQVGEAKVITDEQRINQIEKQINPPAEQKIVVGLEGGLIQWISGKNIENLSVLIADFDVGGQDYPKVETFTGYSEPCHLYEDWIGNSPEIVDHYYDQLEKLDN